MQSTPGGRPRHGSAAVFCLIFGCCFMAAACACSPNPSSQGASGSGAPGFASGTRFTSDQPDDLAGPQVKVLYVVPRHVVPSDRPDRQLDVDGTLERSIAALQGWMERESGGQRFRLDTRNGRLDIAMVRLTLTDAQVMKGGDRQRDLLERELKKLGFNVPEKIYAVYYEGGHKHRCADSFRPPGLKGNVVAFYLHGTPPGARPCNTNAFAATDTSPEYIEFSMGHELFHAMGFVSDCPKNDDDQGHVHDDRTDLMYAGPSPWLPSKLDVNRDDYFKHGGSCPDASQSVYLTR